MTTTPKHPSNSNEVRDSMRKKAWQRWFLLASLPLWGAALHATAALAQTTCTPQEVHQEYSGTVTLHNGPGCAGTTQIPLAIRGPDHEEWQGYFYFNPPDNVGCPTGTLDFYWGASGGHSGHYNFLAHNRLLAFRPDGIGHLHDLSCSAKGRSTSTLSIDEQPEIRSPQKAPPCAQAIPTPCPTAPNTGSPSTC
jgi:hypothetical protein